LSEMCVTTCRHAEIKSKSKLEGVMRVKGQSASAL